MKTLIATLVALLALTATAEAGRCPSRAYCEAHGWRWVSGAHHRASKPPSPPRAEEVAARTPARQAPEPPRRQPEPQQLRDGAFVASAPPAASAPAEQAAAWIGENVYNDPVWRVRPAPTGRSANEEVAARFWIREIVRR